MLHRLLEHRATWALGFAVILASCTTLVEVDLPDATPQGVMEASVRLGEPPVVILTTTQGYFDPVDLSTLNDLFVGDAEVTCTVDGVTVPLPALCTGDLPPEALDAAADFLGFDPAVLANAEFCVYTGFAAPETYGEVGKQYQIQALWSDSVQSYDLTASASLRPLPALDSVWFDIPESSTNDSLGLIWTQFTDPVGFGNAYRWSSKRENLGEDFFYPLGSVFDDVFVDGLTFPFSNFRSPQPGEEETPGEEGFWKVGDTVVVRMEAIDYEVFEVLRDFENSVANQGNPFALPTSASTTVDGGLGWFAAYSGVTDTVVCAP